MIVRVGPPYLEYSRKYRFCHLDIGSLFEWRGRLWHKVTYQCARRAPFERGTSVEWLNGQYKNMNRGEWVRVVAIRHPEF